MAGNADSLLTLILIDFIYFLGGLLLIAVASFLPPTQAALPSQAELVNWYLQGGAILSVGNIVFFASLINSAR